jgi:hypothetical protein
MKRLRRSFGICVVLATYSTVLQAAAPKGWFVAGSKPAEYESGVDTTAARADHPSAFLKAKSASSDGFGTLMQDFRADHSAGKRVRFSAFVKTTNAQWAGLWMRVDEGAEMVAFDNMQNRPIKGSSDWQKYDVVLDVPQDATGIFLGVLLAGGAGEVWINDAKIEVVGSEVFPTGAPAQTLPEEPTNLDFRE